MTTPSRPKLTVFTKLIYGSGDLGFALSDAMLGVLIAIFLVDVVGLRPELAAAAVFIGRTWDYINDPLFGYISDRTRTRWGRRRPFLLFGFIPYALAFTLLWWKPPFSEQLALAIYYAAAYAFYDSAASFAYMPYYALTPELSDDYDERTSLTTYRMVFSIVGSMIAFTLPLALIGTMRPENSGKILLVGAAMAAVSAMPLLLVFLGTRERAEHLELPPPGLKESLQAAIRNKAFLYTMGIFLFTFTGLEIIQGILLFYLKYRMGLETQGDTILAAMFITALLSLPLWNWISGRWDKRTAYITGMLYLALVMTLTLAIQPDWGLSAVMILAVLAGAGFGCVQVLPWAIIPDVVEYDELQSGQRHEGMFYSLVTLFRKVASSLAIPSTLMLLGWAGYVANAPQQSPRVVGGMVALMGPIPALLFLAGAVFALRLPITRQDFARVRQELEKKRSSSMKID